MFNRFVLALLAALPVSAALSQPVRPAQATFCQIVELHRKAKENPASAPRFAVIRETGKVAKREGSRLAPTLKPHEAFAVQSVALFNGSSVLTPPQSVEVFFDLKSAIGSASGEINYLDIHNTATSKRAEVAVATYFPGDNEYGLVYRVVRGATVSAPVSMTIIGVVRDGEISCLDLAATPQN